MTSIQKTRIVNSIINTLNKDSVLDHEDCLLLSTLIRKFDLVCHIESLLTSFNNEYNNNFKNNLNDNNIYS